MTDSDALYVGDGVKRTGCSMTDSNTDVSDTHTFLLYRYEQTRWRVCVGVLL